MGTGTSMVIISVVSSQCINSALSLSNASFRVVPLPILPGTAGMMASYNPVE